MPTKKKKQPKTHSLLVKLPPMTQEQIEEGIRNTWPDENPPAKKQRKADLVLAQIPGTREYPITHELLIALGFKKYDDEYYGMRLESLPKRPYIIFYADYCDDDHTIDEGALFWASTRGNNGTDGNEIGVTKLNELVEGIAGCAMEYLRWHVNNLLDFAE